MSEAIASSAVDINKLIEASDASELDGKYLSFWTDGQLFALPIADVVQIVGVPSITRLPDGPHYLKGIINLRGTFIPIIDLRLRMSKPEVPYDERTCIIITSLEDTLIGFVVDAVDEVSAIDDSQISPPPQLGSTYKDSYLTGIAKKADGAILLISAQKLLGDDYE